MPALTYALITPSFRGDFERCRLLVESVARWVSVPMTHYLVVDRRDLEMFRALENPRTRLLTVEDIIPWWLIRIPGVPKVWLSLRSLPVRNWILQQIVKLSIAEHVREDVLLFADSDTFFVREFDPGALEREGQPPLFVEYGQRGLIENNDRWHQVAARLLGISALESYDTNFIGNVICWRRDHALALLQRLAQVGSRDWRLTLVNQFVFSEYILYGLFATEVLGRDRCQQWQDTVIRTHTHWDPRPLDEAELVAFRGGLQPHHHSVMISAKSRTPVELIRRVFA
jgi:hypothetical protein